MEHIVEFLIYTGKTAYTTLPGIISNMAPLFVKKIPFLNVPLDFGKTINGKPIFGPNKTYRGIAAGTIAGLIVVFIQYAVYRFTSLKGLTLYSFEEINWIMLGFLMGFGVVFGDAAASFIKRRLNVGPGRSLLFMDQLDCVTGGLLFGRIVWAYSFRYAATIIVFTFFAHIIGRHIGYYLRVTDSKW